MALTKGKIIRLLASAILKRATVSSVQDIGGFRLLQLRTDVASFAAGTKLQLLLPSDGMRTYTPIGGARASLMLLGWTHAGGPGADWVSKVSVGEEVRFVGPQRSLEVAPGPMILVGDETSVAVAAAFSAERPSQVHAIIQTDFTEATREAAKIMHIGSLEVVPRGDNTTTVERITSKLKSLSNATVVLTGCSESVIAIRAALRLAGIRDVKTKPYWIPGKRGLD